MDDVTCPYCNKTFELYDAFEYRMEDDQKSEVECENCEKKFIIRASWSCTFFEEKADCLNGADHKWKNRVAAPRKYAVGKQMCEDCGGEREISSDEWEKIEADDTHPQNWRQKNVTQ